MNAVRNWGPMMFSVRKYERPRTLVGSTEKMSKEAATRIVAEKRECSVRSEVCKERGVALTRSVLTEQRGKLAAKKD